MIVGLGLDKSLRHWNTI